MYNSDYYLRREDNFNDKINDCKVRKDSLQSYIDKLEDIVPKIEAAAEDLSVASLALEEGVIINGKPYDKGEYKVYSQELKDIKIDFEDILLKARGNITELEQNINNYQDEKDRAHENYLAAWRKENNG
mgnify:CR=1 FL=1|jgi:hypothetical protein